MAEPSSPTTSENYNIVWSFIGALSATSATTALSGVVGLDFNPGVFGFLTRGQLETRAYYALPLLSFIVIFLTIVLLFFNNIFCSEEVRWPLRMPSPWKLTIDPNDPLSKLIQITCFFGFLVFPCLVELKCLLKFFEGTYYFDDASHNMGNWMGHFHYHRDAFSGHYRYNGDTDYVPLFIPVLYIIIVVISWVLVSIAFSKVFLFSGGPREIVTDDGQHLTEMEPPHDQHAVDAESVERTAKLHGRMPWSKLTLSQCERSDITIEADTWARSA